MKWAAETDRGTIVLLLTIAGIPDEAERYLLAPSGARAVIERYASPPIKRRASSTTPTTGATTITYIVDLIKKKATTVSVETMKIVDGLAGG